MERRILPIVKEDLERKMVLVADPRQCGKTTLARTIVADAGGHYYSWDIARDRKALRDLHLDASSPMWAFDEIHKYSRWRNWMTDVEGEKAAVRFLRDTSGREVDFVLLRNGKPWMAVEVKGSGGPLSPHLRYFAERMTVPYVFQLAWKAKEDVLLPSIHGSKVRTTSVARFLANLP